LSYDETLFDEVNIKAEGNDWHFEQNQDKNNENCGKFVIYTMKDGVTENQKVAEITLKLKDNVKTQITEVKFTKLQSSDGEVSVDEGDKTAVIEVYHTKVNPQQPDEQGTQEEPKTPETTEEPKTPETTEEPKTPEKT